MALGAVATGKIKAHEALIVAGIINMEAFDMLSNARTVSAMIGRRRSVDAVLLVISVKKVTAKQVNKINRKG